MTQAKKEDMDSQPLISDNLPAVTPLRIQLKRTKGWTMPPNTVKVDRKSVFGNPFAVGKRGPGGFIAADNRHAWQLFLGFAPQNAMLGAAAREQLRG